MNKPSEPFKTHFFFYARGQELAVCHQEFHPHLKSTADFFIRDPQVGCLFASSIHWKCHCIVLQLGSEGFPVVSLHSRVCKLKSMNGRSEASDNEVV